MSVPLSQLKKALKIEYDYDDNELLRLRDAVIDIISKYTGWEMYPTKKTQYLYYFMRTRLKYYPFDDVESVTYTDPNGDEQTMLSSDWFLDRSVEPSVYINFREYPAIKDGTNVLVTYKCGLSSYDKSVEQLIISMVGAWYNNPESVQPIGLSEVPLSAKFILDQIRIQNGVLE